MMGPIKFLFYRAARDYADYRIIQAEKAQAAAQSEACELAGTLADTRAELADWQMQAREARQLLEDHKRMNSAVVVETAGHIPTLNMGEGVGA